MLKPNPLCPPPVPVRTGRGAESVAGDVPPRWHQPFVSAEDFDATGILAGMDCCESRYWWVPELHVAASGSDAQATSRPVARPPAAA
jgi:hypothetical protein